MKLTEVIFNLQKLVDEGHGDLEVYYRHSGSGDCGPLESGRVTNSVNDCGPFDLEDGENYISVSVGY
jgi:hypothetical protein